MLPLTAKDRAAAIGDYADRKAQEFESESFLVQSHELRPVIKLDWQDIQIGKLLGRGGYSDVHVCEFHDTNKVKQLDPEHSDHFAVKKLRSTVMSDQGMFIRSASDLLIESKILQRIQHEHIIKLYAVKSGSASASFRGSMNGYFLVYEMLYDLLANRMNEWAKQSSLASKMTGKPSKKDIFRRIKVALQVAKGMEYLHSNRIIYRDIKPENVGFDSHDTVRIYDFGFAREMPLKHSANGAPRRKMTIVGTIRYMAPEVPTQQYGLPVDVYSFGMFFWEIYTLKPLIKHIKTEKQFFEEIKKGPILPSLRQAHLPKHLSDLVSSCWLESPKDRPTFTAICALLRQELVTLSRQLKKK